ncbi:MAG: hypothetical protein RL042_1136 [Nitrospirota bacterium]
MLRNGSKPVFKYGIKGVKRLAAGRNQHMLQPFAPNLTFLQRISRMSSQHILHDSSPQQVR